MEYQNIVVVREQHALIVTVNRPDKLNALNFQTLKELKHFFENVRIGQGASGVILTGAGNKAFVAGADINEFVQLTTQNGRGVAEEGQEIMFLIENCPLPVIAAVNGYALGGGCELALACHMRIAAENAVFGQPEVNLGIIPGYGGSQRLTQIIGKGRAIEMITTARNVKADEALQIGLLNYVVDQGNLIDKCHEIINVLAKKPPIQVSYALKSVNAAYKQNGYEVEADFFGQCMKTKDFEEGVEAFIHKRKPKFEGK